MIKRFLQIIFLVSLVGFAHSPVFADGALSSTYSLTNYFSGAIVGTSTALVTVSGHVSTLDNSSPGAIQIRFKYQKADFTGPIFTDTFFNPQANGDFTNTIGTNNQSPFACGQQYVVWMYEQGDYLIQSQSGNNPASSGFQIEINCAGVIGAGDLIAPDSAGTTMLHGVNWGTVTTTSNSITMTNARVIPFIPNGSKSFKIEYGRGSQNSGQEVLNFSSVFTKNYPYNFNATINVPLPNTSYYFDVLEVTGNLSTALLTYGYAVTAKLDGPSNVHVSFPQDNSVRVYGNLPGSTALYNFPVTVTIFDANNQSVLTADVITGGPDFGQNGNAFFENLFTNVSNAGLAVGSTYTVVISGTVTDTDLTTPVTFTLQAPSGNNGGGGGGGGGGGNTGGGNIDVTPTYNGLIACAGYDCDFNSLINTINRVVNFLIFFIAFPVAGVVIAWAGVLLITSGGSASKKEYAKSVVWHVIAGIVVALLSWAIIKLILIVFGYTPTGQLWSILGTTPSQ